MTLGSRHEHPREFVRVGGVASVGGTNTNRLAGGLARAGPRYPIDAASVIVPTIG